MKRRNPRFGCRRIAQKIAFSFGVGIDKDVVRRVLAKHRGPTSGIVKTHWVMVVSDQFTRRIIGFAVQPGAVDGPALRRMFNQVITGAPTLPQYLSSDHDALFEFHRCRANFAFST
jgi:putative transposase